MQALTDRYQVLVAEDDGGLRLLIAEALTQAGLKVAQAQDGMQAYQILRDNPQPDALLISGMRSSHSSPSGASWIWPSGWFGTVGA